MAARPAVSARIHELIFSGFSNQEIAEIVCREIPGAMTNAKGVSSYRHYLRQAGYDVMSSTQALKSKAAPALVDASSPAKSETSSRLHNWMQSWF